MSGNEIAGWAIMVAVVLPAGLWIWGTVVEDFAYKIRRWRRGY